MDDTDKDLRRTVGRRLRLARKLVELTQQQVADTAGVSRSTTLPLLTCPAAPCGTPRTCCAGTGGRSYRRWRKLSCGRQALLVLAHLRCGDTYARLAAGFGVGVAIVYRYVTELVDLLARSAPDLATAVQSARGKAYVVLDGTLIAMDRVGMRAKTDRPYSPGKHKRHGLNVQVLTDPAGRLIWASPALPGSVHDVKAARQNRLVHALTGYEVPVLADRGYQSAADTIRVPFRGRDFPAGPTAVNTAHARLRAPGEPGPATLKTWRLLHPMIP